MPRFNDPDNYKFEIGKSVQLADGKDVTIIATGLMVNEAVMARDMLEKEGISARVINMHTIKPIDRQAIIDAARDTGAIVTAEEHSVIGGLGGAVCETIPVPVVKVGVEDVFGRSGPAVELLHIYGLDAENIVKKAKQALELKAAR